jgi:hypothetical protein
MTHQGISKKEHIPVFRLVEPCNAVEKSGFPGAIWANDTGDHMLGYYQIDFIDGYQAAKHFG